MMGGTYDCRYCPVARAIRDAIPDLVELKVYGEKIYIHQDGLDDKQYHNDPKIVQKIKDFDRHNVMKPFSFEINHETRSVSLLPG